MGKSLELTTYLKVAEIEEENSFLNNYFLKFLLCNLVDVIK